MLSATSRLAPAGEPGTPLLIHGRVFQRDGRTPAPDIVLFGYHTDAGGHYDVPGAGPHSWRLRGWIKTGTDGRFEIATIRPAPYPNRRTAAHVHWSLEGPGLTRRSTPSLQFTDDDLNTPDDRRASAQAGRFGWIRPVVVRDGVQHVDFNIRIADTGTF